MSQNKKKKRKTEHKDFIERHKCPEKKDCEYYQEYLKGQNSIQKEIRREHRSRNKELLKLIAQFGVMINRWILNYYRGLFTIYHSNPKIQRKLNIWLKNFFLKGTSGIFKLNDSYYVVDVTITIKNTSEEAVSATVIGRGKDNEPINFVIGKNSGLDKDGKEDKTKFQSLETLAIMDSSDEVSVIDFVCPLRGLVETVFSVLIKKLGNTNLHTILGVSKENYVNSVNELLNLWYSNDGMIGFIKLENMDKIKEFKLSDTTASDIKVLLENLIQVLNLIKQFRGMRQNENFMSDRNIKLGVQQATIVFSFFEKTIEEDINYGIADLIEKFGKDSTNKIDWTLTKLIKHIEVNTDEIKIDNKNETIKVETEVIENE